MCGRYALYRTGELEQDFHAEPPSFVPRDSYNIAPGQEQPIVRESGGRRSITAMKWGFVPPWAKDTRVGYKMINARAEGLFDKPTWRGPAQHQRCLVPASGFFEWRPGTTGHPKQPFFIHPTDQVQFAFAGLYSRWHRGEPDELTTYSITTTQANRDMATIHDRMPVILHPDHWDIWLDPELTDRDVLTELLHPYEDGKLSLYAVSPDVNSVQHNSDYLVQPLTAS
jgi:putative SOS response-associated peptidase YedK